MTDDIVERLRADWPDMNDARDAADEITRLRAELAAANEANIDLRKAAAVFKSDWLAARAELAAARELLKEARKLIARCDPQDFFNMLARIDAALEGAGDE